MTDFGEYCYSINCPFINGGFLLNKEGYQEFLEHEKKCEWASNCSYVDNFRETAEQLEIADRD